MLRHTPLKTKTPLKRTAMKRKASRNAPNTKERNYHAEVRDLVCQLSVTWGDECGGCTTVSHRPGAGMGLKSSHYDVAAICVNHHLQGENSIEGMGIKAWRRKYGEHEEYERMTREKIGIDYD